MRNSKYIETSIGRLLIAEENGKIVELSTGKELLTDLHQPSDLLKKAEKELLEYLEGLRTDFDLPLNAQGTEFRRKVWDALREIPYGEVLSYGDVAKRIGCPKGARAVGQACNQNPIMIFIPCHRVIGGTGKLVGFGGGLDMKEKLLNLERRG